MLNDFELASKYNDISTSEKPKIPKYHGDMFIDVEAEYLMRKKFQQKIDKAIEYIESYNLPKDLGSLSEAPISVSELKELLEILK